MLYVGQMVKDPTGRVLGKVVAITATGVKVRSASGLVATFARSLVRPA